MAVTIVGWCTVVLANSSACGGGKTAPIDAIRDVAPADAQPDRVRDAAVHPDAGVFDSGQDIASPRADASTGETTTDTGIVDAASPEIPDGAPDGATSEAGVPLKPGSFTALPALNTPRSHHSVTVLSDGKVLIVGGAYGVYSPVKVRVEPVRTNSAELYDPATETFTPTGSLSVTRYDHTATLLPDGKVLVAGGSTDLIANASAELYDPVTGTFQPTGALLAPRTGHTATLLANGKVLIAGSDGGTTASCELYDPTTGGFTATGAMASAQSVYSATLLENGKVLVVGGASSGSAGAFITAELYDPATGTFSETGRPSVWRANYAAIRLTDGRVLIAGGEGTSPVPLVYTPLASAEVYDPATGTFTPTGAMTNPRGEHTMTLLADGSVLVAGGRNRGPSSTVQDFPATAEIYDPASGTFTNTGALVMGRAGHRAVSLPSGEVLLVGGDAGLNTAELYDPTAGTFRSRSLAREGHTATLLTNGKVLFSTSSLPANGVLYDPVARVFTGTGPMVKVRARHTATLLADGRVLFAGGSNVDVVELYDPTAAAFLAVATMTPRSGNTATLLADGRVLLAGGGTGTEVFDATTASFSRSDATYSGGSGHTATLLPDGMVLLVGGWSLASAELYDPSTGGLAATGPLAKGRVHHTATRLPDGRVLVVGGWSGEFAPSSGTYVGEPVASAEVYDASTRSFSVAGSLLTARLYHSATLLPDGRVLIAGGSDYLPSPGGSRGPRPLASTEVYDPATGSFSPGPSMAMPRVSPTATLLPDGDVLVVGGHAAGYRGHDTVALAELYR